MTYASGLLSARVSERLSEEGVMHFSPAALEALRLCDVFDNVQPEDYVLPIDAMAGFPTMPSTRNEQETTVQFSRL